VVRRQLHVPMEAVHGLRAAVVGEWAGEGVRGSCRRHKANGVRSVPRGSSLKVTGASAKDLVLW
jgi:hypothetical protein